MGCNKAACRASQNANATMRVIGFQIRLRQLLLVVAYVALLLWWFCPSADTRVVRSKFPTNVMFLGPARFSTKDQWEAFTRISDGAHLQKPIDPTLAPEFVELQDDPMDVAADLLEEWLGVDVQISVAAAVEGKFGPALTGRVSRAHCLADIDRLLAQHDRRILAEGGMLLIVTAGEYDAVVNVVDFHRNDLLLVDDSCLTWRLSDDPARSDYSVTHRGLGFLVFLESPPRFGSASQFIVAASLRKHALVIPRSAWQLTWFDVLVVVLPLAMMVLEARWARRATPRKRIAKASTEK